MPTPAEKKALGFLAAVAIAGAATRATGAASSAQTADAASRDALRRQIVAVESAGASDRRKRNGVVKGQGSAGQRSRQPSSGTRGRQDSPALTQLPPSSDIEDPRSIFAPTVVQPSTRKARKHDQATGTPIDVDVATAEELERLPRIGPALANRITTDRAQLGPFGSLDGLQRVRGVGPAMARELAPYVTFSGTPRPSIAGEVGASAVSGVTRKSRVSTGLAPERRKQRPVPP